MQTLKQKIIFKKDISNQWIFGNEDACVLILPGLLHNTPFNQSSLDVE